MQYFRDTMKKMKNKKELWLFVIVLLCIAFPLLNHKEAHAAVKDITLYQFHPDSQGIYDAGRLEYCYYILYPNGKNLDYKKFMKYTYEISDDSVIGLRENGNYDAASLWIFTEEKGDLTIAPFDIEVHALGPGTATLKVYNGKKLIDQYKFTVVADYLHSPSSFINNSGDKAGDTLYSTEKANYSLTGKEFNKESDKIKAIAKAAADGKYTSTNQRILAVLNKTASYGSKFISAKKYKELDYLNSKKGISLLHRYQNAYSVLFDTQATAAGFASLNKGILSNLGFDCRIETDRKEGQFGCDTWNRVEIYRQTKIEYIYDDGLDEETLGDGGGEISEGLKMAGFSTAGKLASDYDFSGADMDTIYQKTHLPAWIIGEDTPQQVLSAGQTKSLSSGSMNANAFSTDPSIVTVEDGKITGVKPGMAAIYRYDENYCDVFYVMVKRKGEVKKIQAKIYKTEPKSFFTSADHAPYLIGGQYEASRVESWEGIRLFNWEPAFGHGGSITTKYNKGQLTFYMNYNGETQELDASGENE